MYLIIFSVFKQNENRNMEMVIYKCAVKETRSRQKLIYEMIILLFSMVVLHIVFGPQYCVQFIKADRQTYCFLCHYKILYGNCCMNCFEIL